MCRTYLSDRTARKVYPSRTSTKKLSVYSFHLCLIIIISLCTCRMFLRGGRASFKRQKERRTTKGKAYHHLSIHINLLILLFVLNFFASLYIFPLLLARVSHTIIFNRFDVVVVRDIHLNHPL